WFLLSCGGMGGLRLIVLVTGMVLAVPVVAVTAGSAPAVAHDGDQVPCPRTEVADPPATPAPPDPPPPPPGHRQPCGAALATAGLVSPRSAPEPPELTARTWLVADLDPGEVLGGCGPHEYGIPASTQKLLLAAAFLAELDPDQVVKVTREDLDFEPG